MGLHIVLAQSSFSIIDKLRRYDLNEINLKSYPNDSFSLKMIKWQTDFLKHYEVDNDGFEVFDKIVEVPETSSHLGKFYYYLNSGDYLFYKYHDKNFEARRFYLNALKFAEGLGDVYMECEVLKRILNLNRQSYLKD
ncbi:MAG: hypothetical protein AAGB24_06885, partial [Bacteroidota bacterium]